uniref:Uncharacterized protein n=1 Tax=Cacopsylla melanoneura TaxID=428564 RepID=A0A8D8V928_9HEMI
MLPSHQLHCVLLTRVLHTAHSVYSVLCSHSSWRRLVLVVILHVVIASLLPLPAGRTPGPRMTFSLTPVAPVVGLYFRSNRVSLCLHSCSIVAAMSSILIVVVPTIVCNAIVFLSAVVCICPSVARTPRSSPSSWSPASHLSSTDRSLLSTLRPERLSPFQALY